MLSIFNCTKNILNICDLGVLSVFYPLVNIIKISYALSIMTLLFDYNKYETFCEQSFPLGDKTFFHPSIATADVTFHSNQLE